MLRIAIHSTIALFCMVHAGLADVLAFPGAEGFGATATGGRGGDVYYVTTLDNDGPGSLRHAARRGNRTILFKTSGTINLKSTLNVSESNITIAGQTAPGDGICLRGKGMMISGDNVIVRYLRIRPGDERHEEHDALTVSGADHVMIDHCSLSWSVDSLNDVVGRSSHVTVQWCILSEPLNDSVHKKGAHGYGTGWGSGRDGGNSFHHNLLAHCNSRSPRLGSERSALVDVRNNVIYDMGTGWAYGGEHAHANFVANFFKPGPSTLRPNKIFRVGHADTRMYLDRNVVFGQPQVTQENAVGLAADEGVDLAATLVAGPFETAPVHEDSAVNAYESVLGLAGAIRPKRDAVDTRIIGEVRDGTGKVINSQRDVGGWPDLQSQAPPPDRDGDGMPDAWELKHNLDPQNATDGTAPTIDGTTNLETYLNQLAAPSAP